MHIKPVTDHTAALAGYWEWEVGNENISVDPSLKALLGYGEEEITGDLRSWAPHIEPADRELLKKKYAIHAGSLAKIPFVQEVTFYHKNGNAIYMIISGKIKEWDRMGNPKKMYGSFVDISLHIRAEKELQQQELKKAMDARLEFLSVMSHEIRTPLNAVIGYTNLLLQNPRKDQREYLDVLKFSADNLLTLINDILDFNKMEAGKIIFEAIDFNLRELLENIKAVHRQDADRKELQLELLLDDALPQFIKGDPVRLGQIIANLLSNAIKFTNAGKIQLIVNLVQPYHHKVTLYFEVKDTGIGIPGDQLEHIFQKFSQASSSTTRKYGGTGLGLSICKRLLELVGSTLHVKSNAGAGSSFFFELGFNRSDQQAARPLNPSYFSNPGFPGKEVLITEDNPINVMVVKKFLEKWHITCSIAENGRIALDKIHQHDYDLVLMDLQMPVMDGYEATRAIRNLPGEKYRDLPVIALTASIVSDMKGKILDAGMNDCITKPFKPDELYALLAHYLTPDKKLII